MDADELWSLEHAGWASLCEGTGARFYGDLMTAGAVMVLAHGFVLDRDAVVASLDEAPPWREYRISDERVVGMGPDVVALVYAAHASREDTVFDALMSSVYVRGDGRWRLALYQQTPLTTGR
ncbi:nuclear transport factor 2 family protein [Luteimicrobium sp. NPDC057192]|uniref:nuclear transport factor 2 family protein n=1 Tax=Luteimicrobium sp. NPDC057192 TaxID=3346042 RepID=UPI00363935B9